MKASLKLISGIVAILLLYTWILNIIQPDFITERVEVEVTKDTTVEIDSAKVYREYAETIPKEERDTVYIDTLKIPVPVELEEGLNEYDFTYSDSLITARWVSQVLGELKSQDFEYLIKQRIVKERTLTVTKEITQTINTVRTIHKVRSPKTYFTVGAEFTDLEYLSVKAGFVSRNKYEFSYRYNTGLDTHSIGVSIPLNFNLFNFL